jgi:hypothetical protein
MSKQMVRSYIWDNVESLPPREMEQLQLERLRAGIERVSRTVPFDSRLQIPDSKTGNDRQAS